MSHQSSMRGARFWAWVVQCWVTLLLANLLLMISVIRQLCGRFTQCHSGLSKGHGVFLLLRHQASGVTNLLWVQTWEMGEQFEAKKKTFFDWKKKKKEESILLSSHRKEGQRKERRKIFWWVEWIILTTCNLSLCQRSVCAAENGIHYENMWSSLICLLPLEVNLN